MSRRRVKPRKRVPMVITQPAELTFRHNLRDAATVSFFITLAVAVAATVYATVIVAPGTRDPWGYAIFVAPALVTAVSTFQLCWRGTNAFALQFVFRLYVVAPFATLVCFLTVLVTIAFVPLQYDRNGTHFLFGGPGLALTPLATLLASWLAAVAIFLVIVLPFMSFLRPRVAIAGNLLSERPEHESRNRRAMRALSVLLVLVFLIPSLIAFGTMLENQTAVWIGVVLIPLGVFLMLYVAYMQRQPTFIEIIEDAMNDRPVE